LRIKSLELHGFKSFVDRTTVDFRPGITAVVGPNGCGKSNVVDAIRWAMGEQSPRRLRGKGMDDVIFAGSEARPPVGMAEVVLTFDNQDGQAPPAFTAYREIQIARRLYRTGESEYLINKTVCRLRDVQDFFRDTGIGTRGYTIVEQGHIAEIVSARPEERRLLIEQAAGISKYKARRREAESKIASTEQNLTRVNDVLAEIRRQIASIERQARKAARYKRLRETVRVLELSLAVDDRRELVAEIEGAQERFEGLRDQVTSLETRLAERELALQEARLELTESERVLSRGGEQLLALRGEIKEHEGRIEYGRRERETLAETIAARREELETLRVQRASQEREAEAAADELRRVEDAVATGRDAVMRAETEAAEAGQMLRELEREREQKSGALVEVLTQIARGEDRISAVDDRRAELDARVRSTDESLSVGQNEASRAEGEQRELEDGLRNLLSERDRLMSAHKAALEAHETSVTRARETALRLRETRERRETRRARLASLVEMRERLDDLGAGTRHLLGEDGARERYGLRGLLREGLDVDPGCERAVEAALAERADALVVDRPDRALAAIEALREARAGRAIFAAPPPERDEPLGLVPLGQPLLERVRPQPGTEGVARAVLSGVNLVGSLEEALQVYGAGRLPATFVTERGDVLSPDGTLRGGSEARGVFAREREIRDLEKEVAELDAAVEARDAAHRNAESWLAAAADELDNLRNRHHTAALAVANHEKDLERTRERVKALGEAHAGRAAERSDLLAELESLAEERERLRARLESDAALRASLQREIDALGLRIGSSGRDVQRLETVATEQRVEHAGREERRERLHAASERLRAALAETRAWVGRREEEIERAGARREELARQIAESEEILGGKLREEEAARGTAEEKRDAFERVSARVADLEEEARGIRGESQARREAVSQVEMAVREAELRLRHLEDAIREKWEVDLATWTPPSVEEVEAAAEAAESGAPAGEGGAESATPEAVVALAGDDEDGPESDLVSYDAVKEARRNAERARLPHAERRRELDEAKRKLQALGEVNLGAIEEHEELGERFRFLSQQKEDLEGTLQSLRDAIQRINRTSRKRFRETFEAVSKRFAENFPRLFRGGKASLQLSEHEDVLEAGVDIMAMPPGKRLQNVNLLSGGEKTLTAIALLVAVFQVRPSPFFLLDEVDAALDDANVGRFNEIVRELAQDSQFVLITHNKRTIECADVLYGVTMERKGVSKLVSVELH